MKETLSKPIGPLPMGAWLIIIAAGVWWGRKHHASGAKPAAAVATTTDSDDDGTYSAQGTSAVGNDQWASTGLTNVSSSGTTYTDDQQWGTAAVRQLIGMGYDPVKASQAVGDYVGGVNIGDTKAIAMIDAALKSVGAPPDLLINPGQVSYANAPTVKATPAKPTTPPKPTAIKKPAAPAKVTPKVAPAKPVVYTVKQGDNLTKIAQAHGTKWQTVYQANKKTIGSNPNLIKPGQKLTIAH